MAKSKDEKKNDDLAVLERVKRLAVMAMFSDDELLDELVLKGGNAMALIHKLTSRESVDLALSMPPAFPARACGQLRGSRENRWSGPLR